MMLLIWISLLHEWQAQVVRTEGVVDEASRVIYAVAQVVDPYGVLGQSDQDELKVGTFVRAAIEGRSAGNVVVLPRFVLRENNTVLVADADNKLDVRTVEVVRSEPNQVYIASGVSTGEKVVTTTLDVPVTGLELTIAGERDNTAPAPATGDVVTAVTEGGE